MRRDEVLDALGQIEGRVQALRAYAGTDTHTHLVGLLCALQTTYMHDLVDIAPEALALKQGALRQVMVLLDAIDGPQALTPRL